MSVWHWIIVIGMIGAVVLMVRWLSSRSKSAPGALYGVGGWLAFLVVILSVISPLKAFGETAKVLREAVQAYPEVVTVPAWSGYVAGVWVLLAGVVGWQWYVCWLLANRFEPRSINWAKVLLLAAPIATLLCDMALGQFFLGVSDPSDSIASTLGALLSGLIWIGYLSKSRRVANTYYAGSKSAVRPDPSTPAGREEPELSAAPVAPLPMREISRPAEDERAPTPAHASSPAIGPLEERLAQLKRLRDNGLIDHGDFEAKKAELLRGL